MDGLLVEIPGMEGTILYLFRFGVHLPHLQIVTPRADPHTTPGMPYRSKSPNFVVASSTRKKLGREAATEPK